MVSQEASREELAGTNEMRLYIRRGGRGREWHGALSDLLYIRPEKSKMSIKYSKISKLCTESSCSHTKAFINFKITQGQTYLPSG